MDDDFGADDDLFAALASSELSTTRQPSRVQQPVPQKIQQPTPQRLDKAPPSNASGTKVVQPTPQALPQRSSGSAIQVSPRQRGNPVIAALRSLPWEYSDIPADFVLGLTTCALFLSLKYHRLHPEYIYTRIRNLQGKYNLRILLTMVDIPNHEDSLRELSKTSLVNNVTIILCWSAAEAARYLELYKSYEHASFGAIRGQQASSYAEKLVEFVTTPRSVNKADAVSLVSNFGSLKNAINADPDQIGVITGWGTVKVNKWCKAVEEPFRVKTSAKRKIHATERSGGNGASARPSKLDQSVPIGRVPLREMSTAMESTDDGPSRGSPAKDVRAGKQHDRPKQFQLYDPDLDDDDEDEAAMVAAAIEESKRTAQASQLKQLGGGSTRDEQLADGVAAALARLRDHG